MGSKRPPSSESIDRAFQSRRPVTLPTQAYDDERIEWAPRDSPVPVWAWVQFTEGPAEKIAAVAEGWTSRVVLLRVPSTGGERSVVVWRLAVTRRAV
ncbi:hypothetical protein [Microbacterium sp. KNMS]